MSLVRSFAPLARPDALVLILGSMPGVRSLEQQEYYAHPRNAFWPIMAELFNFASDLPYPQRLQRLQSKRVALWDVLASCWRPGSLDTTIDGNSAQPNDFCNFLLTLPHLRAIFFNGSKAEQLFRRLVVPQLGALPSELRLERLPSTSPANARLDLGRKLEHWRAMSQALNTP